MTQPTFEERACYRDSYRFFDTVIAIRSDSREFLDLFADMYRRFRVDGQDEVQVTYRVMAESGTLAVDDEVLTLDDLETLADRAYERILDSIVAKIRSHILVHAGVVSWNGRGVVLPAYSGHGKTTLILELVRRGFKFLSDEIAPFDRIHRQVAPFPRSLRVRPGTLALCGLTAPAVPATNWRDKRILDIEGIQPGSLGEACLAGYVIVLSNPSDSRHGIEEHERTLYVIPERITAGLVREMGRIGGMKDVARVPEATLPVLRLCVERGTPVSPRIEEICHRQGVRILDVIRGGERRPDFRTSPRLERISSAEATMELIRRFRGGRKSALLQQEHQGSATRLFMELADIVRQMRCYRLSVGRLDEMADLIHDLVNGGQTHGLPKLPAPVPGGVVGRHKEVLQ